MTLIDRTLGYFAPETALRRESARRRLNTLRSYEGAGRGTRLGEWGIGKKKPDPLDHKALRDRARYLVKNNPYAVAALRALTSYVIGAGIRPYSTDQRVDDTLKEWADSSICDYFSDHTLYGLQATAFQHMVTDGEIFIQRIIDRDASVPLKLRLIEADMLDESKTVGSVIQGIEYDVNSQRVAYYFFDSRESSYKLPTSKRIPAEDIIHLYRKDSASQNRGVSWFSPVIIRLKDFDEFEDAELLRQKIAACFVGFYKDLESQGEDPFSNSDGTPRQMVPGTLVSCPSGQGIEFANPPQPMSYASFAEHSKLTLATGLGVPYMMLSGDYSRSNYSSSRMSMLNYHRYTKTIQENTILPKLKLIEAWLLGTMELIGVSASSSFVWAVPPREFVDPIKDVESYKAMVESGFQSHASVIRELGSDPADVYAEIKDNMQQLKSIGINIFRDGNNDNAQ